MKYYSGTIRADGTLTDPRFPIAQWNLHYRTIGGEARTNNSAEAAHRSLQSLFECTHPSLWNFINTLHRAQKGRDAEYAYYVAGNNPPPKAKKYRDADARILQIFTRYNPRNMEEFLRGMARNCSMLG